MQFGRFTPNLIIVRADISFLPPDYGKVSTMDIPVRATNILWHQTQVQREDRENILRQRSVTLWFTGLPSSGKSTTAFALEYELTKRGCLSYVLDGDNVRHGLNKDLAFSAKDREENIRRIAEVAKLFADAGLIVMTSFISPYRKERDFARQIHNAAGLKFVEIYVDTPLEVCEMRDPKGMYKKARKGEVKGFTGVDDPYEPPIRPEIVIHTEKNTPEQIVDNIIEFLINNEVLTFPGSG
ncbi:MAG TPA: adenylyl-sulfate kinase [Syntrophobacteraceae bacterium]|nr:adenylyl-sulfate kinase [Syntrophobacteraceae bacterium]